MTQTNARDQNVSEHGAASDTQRMAEILTADIDIRIARDGTWYHEGGAIRRKPLVKLFAGILRRDDDGAYVLVTPVERRRIQVEDAPFVAVEATVSGEGSEQAIIFRTNVDDEVAAGPDHPIRVVVDPETGEPSPYVMVREGLEALIARSVYYQLVEAGRVVDSDEGEVLGIDSCGSFYVLGALTDES
jgi:hypothetical protein